MSNNILDYLLLIPLKSLYWFTVTFLPPWYNWWVIPIINLPLGVLPLVLHRAILNRKNLIAAPLPPPLKEPGPDLTYWPDDGVGVNRLNPQAAALGSPFGLNMKRIAVNKRLLEYPREVQFLAQKLMARTNFKPAGDQLNVMAAAWIQTMVHDWVMHHDDNKKPSVILSKGAAFGCPMSTFRFSPTLERTTDDSYDNGRVAWWDASFLYGQTNEQVRRGRTYTDGLLKVNTEYPNTLPTKDGILQVGDQKNSWLGVALLQELFLKEHNAIATEIAKNHPELAGNDEELFRRARLVVAAVVAKVHTVDWTCELLKTRTLEVGMKTNWYGLLGALNAPKWLSFWKPLSLIGHKTTNDYGVPFCLTEEFVAVYRLHSLMPDGLLIGEDEKFIPVDEFFAQKGEEFIRSQPDMPEKLLLSVLKYPCGNLELHNYPLAFRTLNPTSDDGVPKPDSDQVDLAALEIWRDRERGIQRHNDFRRALGLRPFKDFDDLTSYISKKPKPELVKDLIEAYGKNGIEDMDLIVGNLAEDKIPGFAISETSFTIFLLMASRRLQTSPFLNEKFTDEIYSSTGKAWVDKTSGLADVLERHYPQIARQIPKGQSAFKPFAAWPSKYTA